MAASMTVVMCTEMYSSDECGVNKSDVAMSAADESQAEKQSTMAAYFLPTRVPATPSVAKPTRITNAACQERPVRTSIAPDWPARAASVIRCAMKTNTATAISVPPIARSPR